MVTRSRRLLVPAVALALAACHRHATLPSVQEGDIVFQTSLSSQSLAIQKATHSQYDHMGVVLFRDKRPYVFEAVATARYTPFDRWIAVGEGGHFAVKRLKRAATTLTPTALERLREAARPFEGRRYDAAFEWSDDRVYCSELVWKIYDRALGVQIGALQHLRDFDLTDAAVQEKLQQRFGEQPPLDETVISPAAMFNASVLETVATR